MPSLLLVSDTVLGSAWPHSSKQITQRPATALTSSGARPLHVLYLIVIYVCLWACDCHMMFVFFLSLLWSHKIDILQVLSLSQLQLPMTHIKFEYPTILFVGILTLQLGMHDDAQVLPSLCQSHDSFLVYDGLFCYSWYSSILVIA